MIRNSSSMSIMIVVFSCLLLFACGGDNDKSSVRITKPQPQITEEISRVDIDFNAEKEEIIQMFAAHSAAHVADDLDEAMKYWLKLEKPEVFLGKHGWGAFMLSEKWSGVMESFELTKKKIGHNPVPNSPEQIGIDSRAKNATARGKVVRDWGGSSKYLAALRKSKNGDWKIRAVDFHSNDHHKLIKEIKNPTQ